VAISKRSSASAHSHTSVAVRVLHRLMATQSRQHELTSPEREPSGFIRIPNLSPLLQSDTITLPDNCVICLDSISDKAVALPCRHEQFDFSCLGTWLQRQPICPLCKTEVAAIRYNAGGRDNSRTQIFPLPPRETPRAPVEGHGLGVHASLPGQRYRQDSLQRQRPNRRRCQHQGSAGWSKDTALDFRRRVYRNQMYSLHVGSNRISRYRNLTPSSFLKDERLVARARMFVRRELQVFDFLNAGPTPAADSSTSRARTQSADFVLEYTISILKSVDLKGSTGQAEELLTDFLGRDNARLFLHELEAWLRSPFETLANWDRNVQYGIPAGENPYPQQTSLGGGYPGGAGHNARRGNAATAPPSWFSDRFILRNRNEPENRP
jgi:hypothetical protein